MCPDAELLSAWTDGEVPSPWKERIASHLEACPGCSEKVAGFKRLSMRLHSSGSYDEVAVVARVAARLGLDAGSEKQAAKVSVAGHRRSVVLATEVQGAGKRALRHRNLALPLPFAAAAAAALLIVGLFSGRMFLGSGASASGSAGSSLAAASEATSQAAVSANLVSEKAASGNAMSGSPTMDSLVRYLETQNAPISITIQLPANGSYGGGGAPMIVKTPPAETVSFPPSSQGLGFVMSGSGK